MVNVASVGHDGPVPLEQVIDRPGLRAVVAGCCAGLALAAAAIGWSFAHANSVPTVDGLSMALVVAVFAVTGLVLVLAVPANRVGWLVLATAAVLGVGTALTEAGVHGVLVAPGSVPGAAALAAVGPGLRAAGWVMAVVAVPLFFP